MKGESNSKLERDFQRNLIKDLRNRFEGSIVIKNDSSYMQGIPDLLILFRSKWATLECKKSANARKQPNQEFYVDKMNGMSFSRFIYPENKTDILDEMEVFFSDGGKDEI